MKLILITVPYLGKPIEDWGHLRHYSSDTFFELVSNAGLKISKILYVGRLHNLTWVYLKVWFAAIWCGFRHTTGYMKNTNYIASPLHRKLIMSLMDKLLIFDEKFQEINHDSTEGGFSCY